MRTLLVGGCSSGVGKTTLVCRILETLPGWGALKITPVRPHACGGPECPECHGMRRDYEFVFEPQDPAGARVGWLRSREDHLSRAVADALARFSDFQGVVVEGNSFARHTTPEKTVMVARVGLDEVKASALALVRVADWVVLNVPAATDPERVREHHMRLTEANEARRVVELDAASPGDASTAAFLAEIRAWARR